MKSFQYTVQNLIGLHARPASQLILAARSYQSDITIEKEHKTADLKSIMSVLKLNVNYKDQILVMANGEDEDEAINGLEEFMKEYL